MVNILRRKQTKVFKLSCSCGARLTSNMGCVLLRGTKYIHKCMPNKDWYGDCSITGEV